MVIPLVIVLLIVDIPSPTTAHRQAAILADPRRVSSCHVGWLLSHRARERQRCSLWASPHPLTVMAGPDPAIPAARVVRIAQLTAGTAVAGMAGSSQTMTVR